jgi:putative photosynthetic complex assembly protein 2
MPAIYAVLVWWFTTGLILFLDGLRPATFPWSLGSASVVLLCALYAMHGSAGDASVAGAYTGFTSAVLVWGWLEMSFLMGIITGPRKRACKDSCGGWSHFIHATQAIIYNEIATLVGAGLVVALTWRAANPCALWTYLVLWSMRLSAKLNLFLGVPNLGDKFLPPHLLYLRGFFKKRPMNLLFPLSVTVSTVVAAKLIQQLLSATDTFALTAHALVASLLVLAIIEHWFMVIPLPSERLWNWALRSHREEPSDPLDRCVPLD